MKTKATHRAALAIAERLVALLDPYCQRIEIAGSLRRRRPEVGDADLLAIPRCEPVTDLTGEPINEIPLLDNLFAREHIPVAGQGQQHRLVVFRGLPCDIFFADPATWAVRMALRTGSADFSHWLVTRRRQGGALPSNARIQDGRLYFDDNPVALAEEEDLFDAIGLPYIPPEQRSVGRWGQYLRRSA